MIKCRIHPKIWESVKKCQNYRFFDIFLDILHKMKENLGQEGQRVKRGLLSFQGKIWNNMISLEK